MFLVLIYIYCWLLCGFSGTITTFFISLSTIKAIKVGGQVEGVNVIWIDSLIGVGSQNNNTRVTFQLILKYRLLYTLTETDVGVV